MLIIRFYLMLFCSPTYSNLVLYLQMNFLCYFCVKMGRQVMNKIKSLILHTEVTVDITSFTFWCLHFIYRNNIKLVRLCIVTLSSFLPCRSIIFFFNSMMRKSRRAVWIWCRVDCLPIIHLWNISESKLFT